LTKLPVEAVVEPYTCVADVGPTLSTEALVGDLQVSTVWQFFYRAIIVHTVQCTGGTEIACRLSVCL